MIFYWESNWELLNYVFFFFENHLYHRERERDPKKMIRLLDQAESEDIELGEI